MNLIAREIFCERDNGITSICLFSSQIWVWCFLGLRRRAASPRVSLPSRLASATALASPHLSLDRLPIHPIRCQVSSVNIHISLLAGSGSKITSSQRLSVPLFVFLYFVFKGSSFTPSSGLYATNNSVSNPANYTATQQVLYKHTHSIYQSSTSAFAFPHSIRQMVLHNYT